MINILRSYRSLFNPNYEVKLYLKLLEKYYMELALVDPFSALDSYYNLLDTFLSLCPYEFDEKFDAVVDAMKDRPKELLELLTKYRFNYIPLIREVHQRLIHSTDRTLTDKPFTQTQSSSINEAMSSFAKKAKRRFATTNDEQTIINCWKECMNFLLERYSKTDGYFASCYVRLNDHKAAANVFDPIVYCNLAARYCPNACRRYLKYVYPQAQMREELELRFADHFYLVNGKKEIRPLEPVSY